MKYFHRINHGDLCRPGFNLLWEPFKKQPHFSGPNAYHEQGGVMLILHIPGRLKRSFAILSRKWTDPTYEFPLGRESK